MTRKFLPSLALICLLSLISISNCEIEVWAGHTLQPRTFIWKRFSLYSKEDAPFGDEDPYIKVEVTRTKTSGFTTYALISRESFENETICTGTQISEAFLDRSVKHETMEFLTSGGTNSHELEYDVKDSGAFYVYVVNCSKDTPMNISIAMEMKNPFGYLPAESCQLLYFDLICIAVYLFLSAIWTFFLWKFKDYTIPIHFYILGVLALSVIDYLLAYMDNKSYNDNGVKLYPASFVSALANSLKNTVARMLILVVCMGYGVVTNAAMKRHQVQIGMLGLFYFIANMIYNIITMIDLHTPVSFGLIMFASVPLSALNCAFFAWSFLSLTKVVKLLTREKQEVKLRIYKKLILVILVAVCFSVGMIVYNLYYKLFHERDELTPLHWTFEAFWHVIFAMVFIAIMILWLPNQNSRIFSVTKQLNDEELELEEDMAPHHHNTFYEEEKLEEEKDEEEDDKARQFYESRVKNSFRIDDEEFEDEILEIENRQTEREEGK